MSGLAAELAWYWWERLSRLKARGNLGVNAVERIENMAADYGHIFGDKLDVLAKSTSNGFEGQGNRLISGLDE